MIRRSFKMNGTSIDIKKQQVENAAIYKLSPFKALSDEQMRLKEKIITFCKENVKNSTPTVLVIHGDAGTGKSVLLNAVFYELQTLSRNKVDDPLYHTNNRFIVNHPEMLKLYKNISEDLPNFRKKDFERPTSFINQMHKQGGTADIVLIDEAHLLLTKSDKYNRFYQENHLEEMIKLSKVVIIVFDEKQMLKMKSCWDKQKLLEIIDQYPNTSFHLTNQFRIKADQDVIEWIEQFVQKRILPLPQKQDFDFQIFDNPVEMYRRIKERNVTHQLSRIVSTYDYPYKLDGKDYFVQEKNFKLRWDRYQPNAKYAWAEREDTIDEVGSVYTVQGFDLNYVGVILGPSVSYDEEHDQIKINSDKYEDQAAFILRKDVKNPEAIKEQIILNSINVLMTRGVHGLYIYPSDATLRKKLLSLSRINGQ